MYQYLHLVSRVSHFPSRFPASPPFSECISIYISCLVFPISHLGSPLPRKEGGASAARAAGAPRDGGASGVSGIARYAPLARSISIAQALSAGMECSSSPPRAPDPCGGVGGWRRRSRFPRKLDRSSPPPPPPPPPTTCGKEGSFSHTSHLPSSK